MTLTRKARRNVETWKREIRAAGHAFQMGCWWEGGGYDSPRNCHTAFCIGGLAEYLFKTPRLERILDIRFTKLSADQEKQISLIQATLYTISRRVTYRVKVWGRLPRGLKNYTDFDRIYPDPAVRAEKACKAIDRAIALIEGIIA